MKDASVGRYIDYLRKNRGYTRTDFIDDIVSLRQYKRYVSGESSIPNKILVKLAKELKLTIPKLISEYKVSLDSEKQFMAECKELYDSGRDKELYKMLISEGRKNTFSEENRFLLKYYINILEDQMNKTSPDIILTRCKKLIKYNTLKDRDIRYDEARLLSFMAYVEPYVTDSREIFELFISKVIDSDYFEGLTLIQRKDMLAVLLATYRGQRDYEKMISFGKRLINIIETSKSFDSLAYCYGVVALGYYNNGKFKEAEKNMRKAFTIDQIFPEPDQSLRNSFLTINSQMPDLSIDPTEYYGE